MGTLTRSELETEIGANLGNRTDLDARIVNFLNFAQDELVRLYPWSDLETLVQATIEPSVKIISLPSTPRDIRSIRIIEDSRSRKLQYMTPRQFDEFIPYPEWYSEYTPSVYTSYRNTIEIWRIPEKQYPVQLRYVAWATAFSSNSDVASDFDHKDDILIAMATAWAFNTLGEHDKASRWYNTANYNIRKAMEEEIAKDTDSTVKHPDNIGIGHGKYWANPFIKGVK
jgi:hypothetical protein